MFFKMKKKILNKASNTIRYIFNCLFAIFEYLSKHDKILSVILSMFLFVFFIFIYLSDKHLENQGVYSICLITGHESIKNKVRTDYTYYYKGEQNAGKHNFSLDMVRKYVVGSRLYMVFNPENQKLLMLDTVPSWYTLGAPDQGWNRIPFECELQRMMKLGHPTPVKEIENWDKTRKPLKKYYQFTSRHEMQPFLNDIFKCIIVEVVPNNVYDYGDIIVYKRPEGGTTMSRIVGLPGDRIATNEYTCIINDRKNTTEVLPEEALYIIENPKQHYTIPVEVVEEKFPNGITARVYRTKNPPEKAKSSIETQLVPEGHFFVLNDSRPFAKDSRYIGSITASSIQGIVVDIKDAGYCY